MKIQRRLNHPLFFLLALVSLAGTAAAQGVGNIATLEGTVEIGRAGAWSTAAVGAEIKQGDVIRTGRPGRVRIVFPDNSVLKLADASEMTITEQVYNPNAQGTSVLNLVRGKARSIVSDYYKDPNARFEVRTATAVSGVRGTDFVVAYDDTDGVTEVVGITGVVAVSGVGQPNRPPVAISGRMQTKVGRDGFASPAMRAGDAEFRQILEDVDFVGHGGPESVTGGVTDGSTVPPPDRVAGANNVLNGGNSPARAFSADGEYPPDAGSLINQPVVGTGELSVPF